MLLEHQHFDLLEKAVLERFVFRPPFRGNHSMDNRACYMHIFDFDEVEIYTPTEHISIEKNEGAVIKCGNYICDWGNRKTKSDQTYEGLVIHFYPDVLRQIYEHKLPAFLERKDKGNKVLVERVEIDRMIENYMQSILFYFKNPSLVDEELIGMKVKELILLLIKTDKSACIQDILQSLFTPQIHSFRQTIQSHLYDETLSVSDLAFLTNHSLASFKRKFKEVFNDSPARYIKSKRLEKAGDLLKSSELSITEIAYDCGFSEVSYFGKVFRKNFDLSPSEYRDKFLT